MRLISMMPYKPNSRSYPVFDATLDGSLASVAASPQLDRSRPDRAGGRNALAADGDWVLEALPGTALAAPARLDVHFAMHTTKGRRWLVRSGLWPCLLHPACASGPHQRRTGLTVTLSARPKTIGSTAATATRALALAALVASLGACVHHRHHKKKLTEAVTMAPSKVMTIGVNSYLWRATLDTLSFMPLLQTDSNGGVIVTDWYSNPKNPDERVKVTVSILDQDLRADAVRVAASRQVLRGSVWIDAPVEAATVQKLEDVILTRARDLRRKTIRG
jgi:hypothetical protein